MSSPRTIGFLLLLTAATFGICLTFPFIALDDAKHIWQNPYVMGGGFEALKFFWTAPYYGLFVPVIYDTWAVLALFTQKFGLTHEISGIGAALFHAACVASHLFNVYLLWILLRHLTSRVSEQTPNDLILFAASVFAIHPLQVEAVAWASGLKDTLSGSLILLAALSFLASFQLPAATPTSNSSKKQKKSASVVDSGIPGFLRHWPRLMFYVFSALAMLAKPIAVVLPIALFVIVLVVDRRLIKKSLPYVLTTLVFAAVIMWMTKGAQPSARLEFTLEFWQRPMVAMVSLGFYIFKIFAPYPLAPDYGLTPPLLLKSPLIPVYFGLAASYLAGLAFSFRHQSARAKFVQIGLLLIGLGFGPVLGLVPFEFQNLSTVADRYFYLFPALGTGLLAMGLAWKLMVVHPIKNANLALLLVVVGWSVLSFIQTTLWSSNEKLFLHTTYVNPASYLSLNNLGLQALRKNDFENAAKYFNEALNVKPDYIAAVANLGVVYFKKQDFPATIQYYQNALAKLPKAGPGSPATFADMHFNLGAAYLNTQQLAAGLENLKLAVAINPDHFMAHFHLGRAMMAQGDKNSAKQHLLQALRLQPGDTRVITELAKMPN